jgi:hypothetical protein
MWWFAFWRNTLAGEYSFFVIIECAPYEYAV